MSSHIIGFLRMCCPNNWSNFMKIHTIICIVFLLFNFNVAYSQNYLSLPEKAKEKPAKYQLVTDPTDIEPTQDVLPYQPWIVYSDRGNNVTYKTPDGSEKFRYLDFMEQFFVIEEKGNYVRLIKDFDIDGIKLSPLATDFGWIKKDKLLLWNHCLVTSKGKINRNAITLNTIEYVELKHNSFTNDSYKVKFRNSPDVDAGNTDKEAPLYEIYYVYKMDNNMALLGTEEIIDDGNLESHKEKILGWVKLERLVLDHRTIIEPNWNNKAKKERNNGLKCKLFMNAESAKNYMQSGKASESNILMDATDFHDRRSMGIWQRFPVKFSPEESDIAIALVGTEYVNSQGEKITIYIPAVAPIYVTEQKYPLFNKFYLYSRVELHSLWDIINKLCVTGNLDEQREKVMSIFTEELRWHFYESDEEIILNLSMKEVYENVFGYYNSAQFISNLKLKDFRNKDKFRDEDFVQYIDRMKNIERKLYSIINMKEKDYKYSFRSNNQPYYWIPENILP